MMKLLMVPLVALSVLAPATATAGEIRLWMSSGARTGGFTSYAVGSAVDPVGANNRHWAWNVTDSDFGPVSVRAYGYRSADDAGNAPYSQFDLQRYDGGLGVCDGSSCTAPQHAVDNDGRNDVIVFDFGVGRRYAGVSFSIGWEQYSGCTASRVDASCPDIQAWVGDTFDPAQGFGGWSQILAGDPQNNIQPQREYAFTSTAQGRYLAIAPQAGSERCLASGRNGGCTSWEYDYFKLQSLVVRSTRQVPEPGSLALLAAGLGLAVAGRRRGQRATRA
jgi:hypothetical protein